MVGWRCCGSLGVFLMFVFFLLINCKYFFINVSLWIMLRGVLISKNDEDFVRVELDYGFYLYIEIFEEFRLF